MFTGLVEGTGRIVSIREGGMARLVIRGGHLAVDTEVGDSVSVNGVCLTVNEVAAGTLVFHAMPETLGRTSLGDLREGSTVNLERAMTPEKRFGGHIVQGHVDGVGEVVTVTPEGPGGGAEIWEFSAPRRCCATPSRKGACAWMELALHSSPLASPRLPSRYCLRRGRRRTCKVSPLETG